MYLISWLMFGARKTSSVLMGRSVIPAWLFLFQFFSPFWSSIDKLTLDLLCMYRHTSTDVNSNCCLLYGAFPSVIGLPFRSFSLIFSSIHRISVLQPLISLISIGTRLPIFNFLCLHPYVLFLGIGFSN